MGLTILRELYRDKSVNEALCSLHRVLHRFDTKMVREQNFCAALAGDSSTLAPFDTPHIFIGVIAEVFLSCIFIVIWASQFLRHSQPFRTQLQSVRNTLGQPMRAARRM